MQVDLSEKILDQLAGSNKCNPVIESQLLKLGKDGDIAKELNALYLASKIIRYKLTKNGTTNDLVYLSAQLERAGKFHLDDAPAVQEAWQYKAPSMDNAYQTKPKIDRLKLKCCKGCKQDLPSTSFAKSAQKCLACSADNPSRYFKRMLGIPAATPGRKKGFVLASKKLAVC